MESVQKAIAFEGLTKDFPLPEKGRFLRAVDNLSLSIDQGCVFGLLGPNGSGKSTTIRMLLGLSQPSRGSVRVFGKDPARRESRRLIGYLPDAPYYQRFLSGRELVEFLGKLSGLSKSQRQERAETLLRQFGLGDAMDRKLGGYSKGMLQRLGFAQALVTDPEILVLDEPTAGVDPVGAAEVGEFVRELKSMGKTVLLCSHLLAQVQDVCDAVGILNKGRLLVSGSIEKLLLDQRSEAVLVEGLGSEGRGELAAWVMERGGLVNQRIRNLETLFRDLLKKDEEGEA